MSDRKSTPPSRQAEEPPELPDLQEVVLGAEELAGYLAELAASRSRVEVRVKTTQTGQARQFALEDLSAAFARGEIASAQLRYRYQGTTWADTLLQGSDGTRLVRIDLDAVGS